MRMTSLLDGGSGRTRGGLGSRDENAAQASGPPSCVALRRAASPALAGLAPCPGVRSGCRKRDLHAPLLMRCAAYLSTCACAVATALIGLGAAFPICRIGAQDGGFKVRPGSPLRMSSSCRIVSFRAVSSVSRPPKGPMATDDDRCVRLRIRQRKGGAFVSEYRTGAALFSSRCARCHWPERWCVSRPSARLPPTVPNRGDHAADWARGRSRSQPHDCTVHCRSTTVGV